jgi:hypothetical protein
MNEYYPWPDPNYAPYYEGAYEPRVGIDVPTWQQVEQFARDTAHQYLPQIDTEKLKRYAKQAQQAAPSLPRIPSVNLSPSINLPNVGDPSAWFGQTPQKVSDAADAAAAAAKEHEETMRIVKYVVVGVGALGGLALLWSIVK